MHMEFGPVVGATETTIDESNYQLGFGVLIKSVRERQGLSINNLASFSNVRRTFVKKIEEGTLPSCYHDMVLRVVGGLGLTLSERERALILVKLCFPVKEKIKKRSRRKKLFPRKFKPAIIWCKDQRQRVA